MDLTKASNTMGGKTAGIYELLGFDLKVALAYTVLLQR